MPRHTAYVSQYICQQDIVQFTDRSELSDHDNHGASSFSTDVCVYACVRACVRVNLVESVFVCICVYVWLTVWL